ncbi:unnamed protein product [Prunus brigantina]
MSACIRGQPDNGECPDTTGLHKKKSLKSTGQVFSLKCLRRNKEKNQKQTYAKRALVFWYSPLVYCLHFPAISIHRQDQ